MTKEYSLVEVQNPYANPNGNYGKEIVAQKQTSSLDDLYPTNIEQVFHLAKKLNLQEKNDKLEDKVRRVNKAIINLFQKEKKFWEEQVYSFEDLKKIIKKNKIDLDIHTILKSIIRCPIANYCFEEVFDNQGNRKYKLTDYIRNLETQ